MTPCSLLSVNRRFGGTYRLHLQGRRNMFSKKPASKEGSILILFNRNLLTRLCKNAIALRGQWATAACSLHVIAQTGGQKSYYIHGQISTAVENCPLETANTIIPPQSTYYSLTRLPLFAKAIFREWKQFYTLPCNIFKTIISYRLNTEIGPPCISLSIPTCDTKP
jgi:hypothetical protein